MVFTLGEFWVTCRTSKKIESIIYTPYNVRNLCRQELQKLKKDFKALKVTFVAAEMNSSIIMFRGQNHYNLIHEYSI